MWRFQLITWFRQVVQCILLWAFYFHVISSCARCHNSVCSQVLSSACSFLFTSLGKCWNCYFRAWYSNIFCNFFQVWWKNVQSDLLCFCTMCIVIFITFYLLCWPELHNRKSVSLLLQVFQFKCNVCMWLTYDVIRLLFSSLDLYSTNLCHLVLACLSLARVKQYVI